MHYAEKCFFFSVQENVSSATQCPTVDLVDFLPATNVCGRYCFSLEHLCVCVCVCVCVIMAKCGPGHKQPGNQTNLPANNSFALVGKSARLS